MIKKKILKKENNMKKLLCTSTFVFLFVCMYFNNQEITDLQKENLIGKVKSITQTSYRAYDKLGKVVKGEREEGFRYVFNKTGIKIEEIRYDAKGGVYFKIRFNDKGKTTEENEYITGGILHRKRAYKYNSKGDMVEINVYWSDGSLLGKAIYKYDDRQNNIEYSVYGSDGSLNSKETYKYDSKGNKTEYCEYNSDDSLNSKETYRYDNKGNIIEANIYNSDNVQLKYSLYKYIFDIKGNWIKKTCYTNNIPNKITERVIEYYE